MFDVRQFYTKHHPQLVGLPFGSVAALVPDAVPSTYLVGQSRERALHSSNPLSSSLSTSLSSSYD